MTTAGSRLSRRRFGGLLLGGSLGAALPLWVGGCATTRNSGAARDGLPRSHPEEQGTDPRAILSFLDDVSAAGLEMHSFMLARRGSVIAEGWWWPYRADRLHMMHSLTKSVAVCGTALAIAEGHFGLDDKVISFFPDELPPTVDDKLAAMTVRNLLTMQTGHAAEVSGSVWRQIKTSWVAEFFKIPITYQPGTKFKYSSAASFMLSAIITRTTGQKLRDYLEPRLFQPLGITGLTWDIGPGGINPGGNGLSWKTVDSLKLGMLHAQNGRWNGRQILPEQWVRDATRSQVADDDVDGGYGYGYQWWMGPGKSYHALGLFTQISMVFPEHDAVLSMTSAIDGSRKLLPIVWHHFPTAFGAGATAGDSSADAALRTRSASLRLLPPVPASSESIAWEKSRLLPGPHRLERGKGPWPLSAREFANKITGRTFAVEDNVDGVQSVRFEFAADRCIFTMRDARGEHRVENGMHDWIEGDTTITGNELHHQYQPDALRVVAGARWLDERTLQLTWQFVETAFRDTVVCRFDGDGMTLDRSVNVNSAATSRPTLRARLS